MLEISKNANKAVKTEEKDEFMDFMGLITEVLVAGKPLPICGRLIKCTPKYIILEKKSGLPVVINRKGIMMAGPTLRQGGE